MKHKSARARTKLILPTAAEDAAINRAIKSDPDTWEMTAKDFAEAVPFPELMKRRGRPKAAVHKHHVNLRLDPEVVEFFQRGGRGWQTRINATLLAHVKRRQAHG